jgi:hypothetical protein
MSNVPDSIRLNKYRALYMGSEKRDPRLALKSKNDRRIYAGILAPPMLKHFTSVQRSHPKNYDLQMTSFKQPLHTIPEERGATRYVRGSALYNQAIQTKIGELAKLSVRSA